MNLKRFLLPLGKFACTFSQKKRLSSNCAMVWKAACWVALAAVSGTHFAFADEFDTVNFVGLRSMRHESNLFRLSSAIDERAALGGKSGSDDITTTAVGLKIDKPYSLQRFTFDMSYVDTDYKKFSYLSFGAVNYNAQWLWQLTPSLHGTISRLHKEQQASFLDYQGIGNRNVTTVELTRADAIYELDGAWKLTGAYTGLAVDNERLIVQESDFEQNAVELGIRRDFSSGSFLALTSTAGRGSFFKRSAPSVDLLIDTGYDDTRNEMRAFWSVTAKSSVDTRIAYVTRKHDNFAQRNFSGGVGQVALRWQPTAKLEVVSSLQRTITSYQGLSSSFIQSDIFSIGPEWRVTNDTTLRALYERQSRRFLGQGPQASTLTQQDTIDSEQLSLSWKPLKQLALNASLQKEQRVSNAIAQDFKNTTATISLQVGF